MIFIQSQHVFCRLPVHRKMIFYDDEAPPHILPPRPCRFHSLPGLSPGGGDGDRRGSASPSNPHPNRLMLNRIRQKSPHGDQIKTSPCSPGLTRQPRKISNSSGSFHVMDAGNERCFAPEYPTPRFVVTDFVSDKKIAPANFEFFNTKMSGYPPVIQQLRWIPVLKFQGSEAGF